MSVGLGRNSPIVLSLGKDNYEALIDRHGQWLRWRIAEKCSCVKGMTMQPDIHCPFCAGRGGIQYLAGRHAGERGQQGQHPGQQRHAQGGL